MKLINKSNIFITLLILTVTLILSGCSKSGEYHEVIFVSDYEICMIRQNFAKDGEKITPPNMEDTPKYNFIGWEMEGGVEFTSKTKVTKDEKVWAIFDENEFIGTVEKNGLRYDCYSSNKASVCGESYQGFGEYEKNLPTNIQIESEVELDGKKYEVTHLMYIHDGLSFRDNITKTIEFPDTIKTIDSLYINIESLNLPNNLHYISTGRLDTNIKEITIDKSNKVYKTIDDCLYSKDEKSFILFPKNKNNESFNLSKKVERIEVSAFAGSKFEEFIIPDHVEHIALSAFQNCDLKTITIGEGVKNIGTIFDVSPGWMFTGSLEEIVFSKNLEFIGGFIYSGFGVKTISIPKNVKEISELFFSGFYALEKVYLDEKNEFFTLEEDVLYSKDKDILYKYFEYKTNKTFVIPNNVKTIDDFAFSMSYELEEVTIPNSVTSIGIGAFANCISLKNAQLSNSLTSISGGLFFGCTSLDEVTIPNSVKSIGVGAFENCSSLKNITIPSSVETIVFSIFVGCSDLVIYTPLVSKPSSWYDDWNSYHGEYNTINYFEVIWGYTS